LIYKAEKIHKKQEISDGVKGIGVPFLIGVYRKTIVGHQRGFEHEGE